MLREFFSTFKCDKKELRSRFVLYPGGWIILVLTLSAASAVCALLGKTTSSDVHVPLVFVLAVMIVSLFTDGFLYGILAAAVSVIGVNYAFTYPYMKLDFSVYGYPLTFMTMLAVGIVVSALTSTLKAQERIRLEAEREKLRGNLLRAVSHDLRTPLTAISGSISTVLDDGSGLTEEQKTELLNDAKNDAEWLCRMVENLLSITRISGCEVGAINKQEEVLEEVLGEAVQKFGKRHGEYKVRVSVPDEMILLPMDAMLIEQVLINLMDNAVHHAEGMTHIDISAKPEKDGVSVSVRDDGKGIKEELLPDIFSGGMQLSGNSSTDKTRSMGIGLSVCRTIIEAHGGSISAKNLPEGGAEFCFTLPLGDACNDSKG